MRQRVTTLWFEIQASLWSLPALLTLCAIALAFLMVRLDRYLLLNRRTEVEWLFGGGAEGARGVLTAIASSTMTVTGTVFSITVVALQLASSQFTPRVLRSFTGDRGNQVVLGVFIGTFTYSLLVLRTVHSASDDRALFVPSASVTVAIVLALASIGFLIFFIHHAARSIQASVIIDRATHDTLQVIDRFERTALLPGVPATPVEDRLLRYQVNATQSGYLHSVDVEGLRDLADAHDLVLVVQPRMGDFIMPGMPLVAYGTPSPRPDANVPDAAEIAERIRPAFVTGLERTLAQDVAYGVRQLSDIALRALSPGINDPTTAMNTIDRLGEIIVRYAQHEDAHRHRDVHRDSCRVVLPLVSSDDLIQHAFAQIRHYGAADATVICHLLGTLQTAARLVPTHADALGTQAACALGAARHHITDAGDLARVEHAAAWTRPAQR